MTREPKIAGSGAVLGRSTWGDVHDTLTSADQDTLDVKQLEALAEADFWLGRPRESISWRLRRRHAGRRSLLSWNQI